MLGNASANISLERRKNAIQSMNALTDQKYLPDLMHSPVISNLTQMGITNMAHRVATNNPLIAGGCVYPHPIGEC